jgi:hypothetical protein
MLQEFARGHGRGEQGVRVERGKKKEKRKSKIRGGRQKERGKRFKETNCDLFILSQQRC